MIIYKLHFLDGILIKNVFLLHFKIINEQKSFILKKKPLPHEIRGNF